MRHHDSVAGVHRGALRPHPVRRLRRVARHQQRADVSPLPHRLRVEWTDFGLLWAGRAWPSFFTTVQLAAIAAPLTAAIGLLTAYLLNRQRFAGQTSFEFITLLSFAIPGTVIGVSYIIAFNVPPIELTGTGAILVLCFVFRNMPVAIRAGIAAMSQIDKSLDECSLTLRHTSFGTLRRVILPLLRPAIVTALVYSFVSSITAVSAVIFLVSAPLQPRHRLYRRARRGVGFRPRHRLFLGAHRVHDGGGRRSSSSRSGAAGRSGGGRAGAAGGLA
jgi:ABC-type spermidine/putrescine transport system permease subunit II